MRRKVCESENEIEMRLNAIECNMQLRGELHKNSYTFAILINK